MYQFFFCLLTSNITPIRQKLVDSLTLYFKEVYYQYLSNKNDIKSDKMAIKLTKINKRLLPEGEFINFLIP